MRWICLLLLPLSALACCPCNEEEEEVLTRTPEHQAELDFYSVYPAWSDVEGRTTEPYSPQYESLHTEAEPAVLGGTQAGLLVCRVAVNSKKNWDPFGHPDPAVRLEIEGAPFSRLADSGRDADIVYLGWTGLALESGAVVELSVTDMDLARHDHIGSAKVAWDGKSPIVLGDEDFDADCRFIPDEMVTRAAQEELTDAKDRLDNFERMQVPNPEGSAWGYPSKAAGQAARAVSSTAALTGWRSPSVIELTGRYSALEQAWLELVRKSILEERDKLPAFGTPVKLEGGLEASVVESVCDMGLANRLSGSDGDRHPCFVRLHLRNGGTEPFAGALRDIEPLERVRLVLPNGTNLEVSPFYGVLADKTRVPEYAPDPEAPQPSFTLAPGAIMEVGVRATHDELPLPESHILRIDKHRLRLR
jgi:hypothetical protein